MIPVTNICDRDYCSRVEATQDLFLPRLKVGFHRKQELVDKYQLECSYIILLINRVKLSRLWRHLDDGTLYI